MKVKEEWKRWFKTQHSETKIMASGPITSWQIDGETVADFIFLGSKITAAMKLKDSCFLEEKTNLDSILKGRLCQQRSV